MKKTCITLVVLWLQPTITQAVTVGNMTLQIPENKISAVEKISNDDPNSAHMITAVVERVDSPMTMKPIAAESEGEILYTPARMVLPNGAETRVNFTYHGPADDKERYYRIVWSDEAVAPRERSSSSALRFEVKPKVSISTVLLVTPRKANFAYSFDGVKLTNSGNASFQAVGYSVCKKREPGDEKYCHQNIWLPPGKTTWFDRLNTQSKEFSIGVWRGDNFIELKRTVGSSNID